MIEIYKSLSKNIKKQGDNLQKGSIHMKLRAYFKEIFIGEEEDLSEKEIKSEVTKTSDFIMWGAFVALFMINMIGAIIFFG